ncbi:MAG TPA: tetratricopeptide repeat protein [Pirellulales bacterium]
MAKKGKPFWRKKPKAGRPGQSGNKNSGPAGLKVRLLPDGTFEFWHPRDVHERKDDLDEVKQMLEAGEYEVAEDELRWLLDGCGPFIEGHRLLGECAVALNEVRLARGHYGYAFELGRKAIGQQKVDGKFLADRPANLAFFEAGKGLALCLADLGRPDEAREVLTRLLKLDPRDPQLLDPVLQSLDQIVARPCTEDDEPDDDDADEGDE